MVARGTGPVGLLPSRSISGPPLPGDMVHWLSKKGESGLFSKRFFPLSDAPADGAKIHPYMIRGLPLKLSMSLCCFTVLLFCKADGGQPI
jgi:hypothetical protein